MTSPLEQAHQAILAGDHESALKHLSQHVPGKSRRKDAEVAKLLYTIKNKLRKESMITFKDYITEATFVSDSPSTGASTGVKFEVKKNAEKSVGEHSNGQPKEHHDVYLNGKHVGSVNTYSAYQDKKPPGSRVVTSRKNVRRWSVTVHGGEHNQHGPYHWATPENSQYVSMQFKNKKDALQHLADSHKSNPNR